MKQRAWTDAERERALQLASEVGAAEASRRTGVPAGTLRAWRSRSGEAGPPGGVDPEDWAERKRQGADDWWQTATDAVRKVRELVRSGDERRAKDLALTAAIAVEKAGMLETAAAQADERQAALTERQAETAVAALTAALADLGIPFRPGSPVAKVLALHLHSHDGESLSKADVEAARRDVRRALDLDRRETPPADPTPQLGAGEPPKPAALPVRAEKREPEPAVKPWNEETWQS